jgi:hypothetical protein
MVLKLLIGIVLCFAVFRIGLFILRGIAHPPPPPEEGELRPVNLRYRCTVCGAEVKMTRAGEDLPEPPRHCLEDMQLVTPVE